LAKLADGGDASRWQGCIKEFASKVVTNVSGMFDMSADDTGWLITLFVVVALIAIVVGARWFWR
jgi:hypothetical protein